jgi:hypothetical protein
MKSLKLKQFAVSFLLISSLFVSAISACACAHHQAKQETATPACHRHPAKTVKNHDAGATENTEASISEAGCVCFQIAPKVFAKSETVKFKKHAAAISSLAPPSIVSAAQIVSEKIDFTKPFYLSDSFYNVSPGRAPPVL